MGAVDRLVVVDEENPMAAWEGRVDKEREDKRMAICLMARLFCCDSIVRYKKGRNVVVYSSDPVLWLCRAEPVKSCLRTQILFHPFFSFALLSTLSFPLVSTNGSITDWCQLCTLFTFCDWFENPSET